jgi:hypothetical protein
MPADNEVFELTLDGDLATNQPSAMIAEFVSGHGEFEYRGRLIVGIETRRFRWVSIGRQFGLATVKRALAGQKVPECQWLNAVVAKYEITPHLRGIANASWVSPDFHANLFPYINSGGNISLEFPGVHMGGYWRWLVEMEE